MHEMIDTACKTSYKIVNVNAFSDAVEGVVGL